MKENNLILVTSTKLLLLCKSKSDIFPVSLSKPTRIFYVRSEEWSTVGADVTYIQKHIKEF
jgi:hypothetical protein